MKKFLRAFLFLSIGLIIGYVIQSKVTVDNYEQKWMQIGTINGVHDCDNGWFLKSATMRVYNNILYFDKNLIKTENLGNKYSLDIGSKTVHITIDKGLIKKSKEKDDDLDFV